MISKYDGICRNCGLPTKAGVDLYDFADKTSYHANGCGNDGDSESLADRLGYRRIGWEELFKVLEQSEQENPCSTNSTKPQD